MRHTLRLYTPIFLQSYAVILCFALIVCIGVRWTDSLDNLFGSYVRIFPFLLIILSWVTVPSLSDWTNTAVGMGARRLHCFWCIELGSLGFCAAQAVAAALVTVFSRSFDAKQLPFLTVPCLLFALLVGLLCGQMALLADCLPVGNVKKLVTTAVFLLLLVVGIFLTVLVGIWDTATALLPYLSAGVLVSVLGVAALYRHRMMLFVVR